MRVCDLPGRALERAHLAGAVKLATTAHWQFDRVQGPTDYRQLTTAAAWEAPSPQSATSCNISKPCNWGRSGYIWQALGETSTTRDSRACIAFFAE